MPSCISGKYEIKKIYIYLTNRCNLKCKYCFIKKRGKDLGIQKIKKAIKTLVSTPGKKKLLIFFGGEPLLKFQDIKESVKFCDKIKKQIRKEVFYLIVTNGTLLDEKKMNFIRKNNIFLQVSFDGKKETQDKYRDNSYNKLMKNIDLIKNYDKHLIGITVDPGNSDKIFENYLFLSKLGLKKICFAPTLCCEWSDKSTNNFIKELNKLTEYYIKRIKEDKTFEEMHIFEGSFCGNGHINYEARCTINESICVDVNGRVFPCEMFVAFKEGFGGEKYLSIGNLDKIDYKKRMKLISHDILHELKIRNPQFKKFKNRICFRYNSKGKKACKKHSVNIMRMMEHYNECKKHIFDEMMESNNLPFMKRFYPKEYELRSDLLLRKKYNKSLNLWKENLDNISKNERYNIEIPLKIPDLKNTEFGRKVIERLGLLKRKKINYVVETILPLCLFDTHTKKQAEGFGVSFELEKCPKRLGSSGDGSVILCSGVKVDKKALISNIKENVCHTQYFKICMNCVYLKSGLCHGVCEKSLSTEGNPRQS